MAKVLIIGSGGREHALGWKLAQSPKVEEVLCLGDNAGMATEPKMRQIPDLKYAKDKFGDIGSLIERENIGITLIGPEQPLVDGFADYLEERGRRVFGPSAAAARLEADKFFSYGIMLKLDIPQARAVLCDQIGDAVRALHGWRDPAGVVLKARGLTGGKGVTVYDNAQQALEDIAQRPGAFAQQLLVAERLRGEEFTVFGISDGQRVYAIPASFQDHKRLENDDMGLMTGGMGAYGPANHVAPPDVVQRVIDEIMTPVVQEMTRNGTPYVGFLYAGMMKTQIGLKVLEFNVRLGDPECQPAMKMLKTDLYDIITGALDGNVPPIELNDGAACCVVLAARGDPDSKKGAAENGKSISGLEYAATIPGVKVFHAGTAIDEVGSIVTKGGRVLDVTAYSPQGIYKAKSLTYEAAEMITIRDGFHYRTDIGARALGR